MLTDIINNRTLLFSLVIRDLKGRYIGSTMGIFWNVVTPLLQLLVYTIVFSTIMKVKPGPEEGTSSFVAFLFCGLIPWNAFAETVQRSAGVILENGNLVKKVKFPMEILVVYLVISSFIHELIALVLFLVLLTATGSLPHLPILLLPLVFILQLILTVGLAMIISTLNVYVRDVAHIMSIVMMVWFYATPIVYPLSLVPGKMKTLMFLNPVTSLVTLYRSLFFSSKIPDIHLFTSLLFFAVLFFVAGYALFMNRKDEFVDMI